MYLMKVPMSYMIFYKIFICKIISILVILFIYLLRQSLISLQQFLQQMTMPSYQKCAKYQQIQATFDQEQPPLEHDALQTPDGMYHNVFQSHASARGKDFAQ